MNKIALPLSEIPITMTKPSMSVLRYSLLVFALTVASFFSGLASAQNLVPVAQAIIFEVAPDPDQQALLQQWRSLNAQQRHAISSTVANHVVPVLLESQHAEGSITAQIGSYLEDTNPSFALHLERGNALNVARQLACVLSQHSVLVMAPESFPGSRSFDTLHMAVGETTLEEIDAIYQKIRRLDELPQINGQTTSRGQMTILLLNGVDASLAAATVEKAFSRQYRTQVGVVHGAWVGQEEATKLDNPASQSPAQPDSTCQTLKAKASRLMGEEVSESKPQ